jgi:predicted dehydrogenase
MKKKFNVGLIGLGTTGSEHIKFYNKNKKVKRVFVSDIKKLKKFKSKKVIIDPALKKFSNIFEEKVVSISNHDKDHFKNIIKHYSAAHIFVEKPLCRSFEETKKIFQLVKKNKFKHLLYSNLVLRNASIFKDILNQISKGEFGKVYYFEGDYLYGRINKIINGWRGKDKSYSVMLGGGIHMVDLMINFFQSLPSHVHSYGNKIATKGKKFKFNDFIQSTYNFDNGAIGKITANFGCVHKHQHVIKVFGTKKSFIYDDMGARIFTKRDPHESKKIKIKKRIYDGKACLLPDFFKKINYSKNYTNDIINELNLISTCVFSDQSILKKKRIKIQYIKKK